MTIPLRDHRPVLVIGYGSPLRRDDGAGPAVAERVRERLEGSEGVVVHVRDQLTPELAGELATARHAILVVAAVALPPGEVTVGAPGTPSAGAPSAGAGARHHVPADELLALAGGLYGSAPPVTVVAIGAADLEPGEGLSGPVAAAVERATTLVLALVDQLGATGPDT